MEKSFVPTQHHIVIMNEMNDDVKRAVSDVSKKFGLNRAIGLLQSDHRSKEKKRLAKIVAEIGYYLL